MTSGCWLAAAAAIAIGGLGCGDGTTTTEEPICPVDQEVLPKAWFEGDAGEAAPTFSLSVTVVGAVLGGFEVDTWVGESWSTQVTARTTEALLVFADATGGDAVSVFDVDHRESACASDDGSSGGPWSERSWFDVDWSLDLSGPNNYAFDAASAAGHEEAVVYGASPMFPPKLDYDLDAGWLTFETGAEIAWEDIDADTPGCAFDLPDEMGPCPEGEIRLAYELTR